MALYNGIALSKDNKLFVCDKDNDRIQVLDNNLKSLVKKEVVRVSSDILVTFDPAGDVYVTEYNDHHVQVFSQMGAFLRSMAVDQAN